MTLNFAESGHPLFRATSALERRELKSKGRCKKSVHFIDGDETIELILRSQLRFVSRIRPEKHSVQGSREFGINGNTDRIS